MSGVSRCSGMFGISSQRMHPRRNKERVCALAALDLSDRSIPRLSRSWTASKEMRGFVRAMPSATGATDDGTTAEWLLGRW